MTNDRLTLALEILGAIEESGITSDELRAAADELRGSDSVKVGGKLVYIAAQMDALAWLDKDDE